MTMNHRKNAIALAVAAFAASTPVWSDAINGSATVSQTVNTTVLENFNTVGLIGITNANVAFDNTVDHDEYINIHKNKTETIGVNQHAQALELDVEIEAPVSVTSNSKVNVTSVEMSKKLFLTKDLMLKGSVRVEGSLAPDSASLAVIDDKQLGEGNLVVGGVNGAGSSSPNTAEASENVAGSATGNIGLNITAGDFNMQDNSAAIAAANDATAVFGQVDAEVFALQQGLDNSTVYQGMVNTASLQQDTLQNASGNLGVNIAAGHNNMEKNNMAASVANAGIAQATVNVQQRLDGNFTQNTGNVANGGNGGPVTGVLQFQEVVFAGPITGTDIGVMSGTYGDPALANPPEESGTFVIGGGPQPGNVFLANHEGTIGANEASTYALGATYAGDFPYFEITNLNGGGVATFAENNATIANNVLQGASGNIGVNLGSGTNNLASNSMAIAVAPAGAP